jgi:YD repeat-containing protein
LPCSFSYEASASQNILAQNPETVGQTLNDGLGNIYYPAPGYSVDCISIITINGVYLDQITTSKGASAKFSYVGRTDVTGDYLVSKIEYGPTGATPLKTYGLSYAYGNSGPGFATASGGSDVYYRPYLVQLRESARNLTETKKHQFGYYSINGLPPRLAYAQDRYGFFNGQNNSGFIPGPVSPIFSYSPADRFSYGAYANYGMLSSITYPTGGSDSLVYEPHGVASAYGTGPVPGASYVGNVGGTRISRVISHDPVTNTDQIKAYRYNKATAPTVSSAVPIGFAANYFSPVEMRIVAPTTGASMINTYTMASGTGDMSAYALDGSPVYYTDVTVSDGLDFANGATLHQFEVLGGRPGPSIERGQAFASMSYGQSGTGQVNERRQLIYRMAGTLQVKLKEILTTYKHIPFENIKSYMGRKNYDWDNYGGNNPYDIASYTFESFWNYSDSTTTITYDHNGLNPMRVVGTTAYGNSLHLLPTQTTTDLSDATKHVRKMRHPHEMVADGNDPTVVYAAMIAKNKISVVVEERELVSPDKLTALKRNNYFEPFANIFVPRTIGIYNNKTGIIEDRVRFHQYNTGGSIQSLSLEKGPKTSYLYSYGRQFPIAEIRNADFASVSGILGASNISAFELSSPDKTAVDNFIAPLRAALPDAHISTFVYLPLVGMSSQTDAKGNTTYYEYDDFQRLSAIKDQNGNMLKFYKYNYGNNENTSLIYARITEENVNVALRWTKADIVVRFYSDAACTVPLSVVNLNVLYNKDQDDGTNIKTSSVVANGTYVLLAAQDTIQENSPAGVPVSYYYYMLRPSSAYVISH